MRKHTKKKESMRASVTRFATSYLTLRHFYETKIVLRVMFAFKEWQMSQYYRKVNDIKVRNIILTD